MEFLEKGSEESLLPCIILIKFCSKFGFINSSLGSVTITAPNTKGNFIKSSVATVTWDWACPLVKLRLFSVLSYLEFTSSETILCIGRGNILAANGMEKDSGDLGSIYWPSINFL